ncbi:response regulator [Desulfobacter vibrioformis]|uniref:response regulator n=1 Tax=Desulfobacter vibrioformis TaxID=34031 RepID=UPI0005557C58|nr:response regulator [Desulfobacter vibrioformis]
MDEQKLIIFALDDDDGDLELFRRTLKQIPQWNIYFTPFTRWETFRTEVKRCALDLLFVDYCLDGLTGLDVINALRKSGEKRPIIVLTGQGDQRVAAEITRAGADDYLVKDQVTPDLLRRTIHSTLERFRAAEERAVLEKQLQEAQKMETLGVLAGGIAHDFNNLLMAIMGYADFAKMKSHGREVEADLDNIIATSKQMANLVRQLLSFSRWERDKMELIEIGQVLSDSLNILRHTLPQNVKFSLDAPKYPALIISNSTLLNQIILNLCINASEAMPDGGDIILKYRSVEVAGNYLLTHPNLCEGKYVLLEIRDSGKGMPEQIRHRIFEPFFTTKQMGRQKGTGLGLSIVWNNVKKMNGWIDVYSEIDAGTVFKIYFPMGRRLSKPHAPKNMENIMGREETILVVDDEKCILNLVSEILARLNYKVCVASNGAAAVDLFKDRHSEIDLVLLDIAMPEMDGKACIQGLIKINPGVKVIFSSGQDLAEEAEALKALGCAGLIQKPYFLADLGARIKEVLG